MRAMVLKNYDKVENKPLKLSELSYDNPKDDEILLKVKACGVCRTDLHEVEGDIQPKLPIIPGHQIVGTVENIGENVTSIKKNERRGVGWLYSTCQKCKFCKSGMENLCKEAQFTGFNVNGGYSEYIIVSEKFSFPIPKNISDEDATPLLCAGIIGYRSIKLSEIQPGERLGLFGFGGSAHLVIQVAKYWDCDVFVFTRSKNHQELARNLGAVWVGTSKDKPPKKLDAAINFAPIGGITIDALKKLKKGGNLAINAIYLTDIPPIKYDDLYFERKITSVTNFTRKDAMEFLKIAGEIPIKTTINEYTLEQANNALKDLKHSNINGTGVLRIS